MKHGYLKNKNNFSFLVNLAIANLYIFLSCTSTCSEIIHSVAWDTSHVPSHAQYRYFVTFIDNNSRFIWVYFPCSKANVLLTFQTFVAYVEAQFST